MNVIFKAKKYEIETILRREVLDEVASGFACGWVRRGRMVSIAYGNQSSEPGSQPMSVEGSYFDIASNTKAVVAVAMWILLTRRQIELDQKVVEMLPEIGGEFREALTMRHLLAHQVYFGGKFSQLLVDAEPGRKCHYTNYPAYLMGKIITIVMGVPLGKALRRLIFDPLSMKHTHFFPLDCQVKRGAIVPTSVPVGAVHDPLTRQHDCAIGTSGLFSTTADMMLFLRFLLDGCSANGETLVSREVFADARTNQSPAGSQPFGLGFYKFGEDYLPRRTAFIREAIMMIGFTGCMIVAHPENGFGVVINSYSPRPAHLSGNAHAPIYGVRKSIISALLN